MMKFLTDAKDVTGKEWPLVIVWDGPVPTDVLMDMPKAELLCWNGHLNALGFD